MHVTWRRVVITLMLQVMMTLGKALDIEADSAQRNSYWFVLSKKRSTDVVGGELCLGFEVSMLDSQQHVQVRSCTACTSLWSTACYALEITVAVTAVVWLSRTTYFDASTSLHQVTAPE